MKKSIIILLVSLLLSSNLGFCAPVAEQVRPSIKNEKTVVQYIDVIPIDVVQNPSKYLNKNVRMIATFDKFSVVGLDYKPAFRSSEDYILFLIRKCEKNGHIIPLSEMKLFITRKKAEKFIDLDAGDEIEITGKVFSTALNDPWIEVDNLKILKSKKETKEEDKK